jgi:hypothetical protein
MRKEISLPDVTARIESAFAQHGRFGLRKAGLLAVLCVFAASPLWAQQNATIVGTITDNSGAVVPGVAVSVTNVNTGVKVNTVTNSAGYYRVQNLIPGQYTVEAEAKGFQKALRTAFTLEVAQTATIDLTLQVGAVTQTVEVTAATPMLQEQTAEIGQVIQRQEVTDLPLVDRNYLKLALLAPGTSGYYNRSFESGALTNNIGTFNSGGEGEDRNAFSLDGGDVKAYLINFSFIPSVDAIQEFKIETTPYAADLGTSPGAQVIITTRSGTNQFHGSGWEFLRNDVLDAKDYFASSKPELRKNQFGGVFGGPIKKDRLFFFVNYEGYRQRVGETFFSTVPTPKMRAGDFSELLSSNPALNRQIYDPATTVPCATCSHGYSRQPFVGNIIPSNRFNSASLALMNAYPAETSSGLTNGYFTGSNYDANGVDKITRNQFSTRIDYSAPNGKDVVYGRFSMENATQDLVKGTFGTASFPGYGDNFTLPSRNVVLHEAHTFSPTTVLEGLFSYFRAFPDIHPDQLVNPTQSILNSTLGIQGVRQNEPPNVSPAGLSNLWSNPFAPEYDLTNQFQYIVKLTKVVGKHSLHIGGEYNRWQFYENHAPRFPMGLYNFSGFTADPNNPGASGSGIADFILGYPSSGQTITGDDSGLFYRNNVRWWVNDQFRVGSNLTLNMGLRWEYDGPECEKYNRLANFDPATGTVIIAGSPYPGESGSKAFFGFPVRGGNCSTINRYYHAFAPRFGFAYSLPGHTNTVIRGGYGIFNDVIQVNILNDTRANFPYANFPNITYLNLYAVNPATTIQQAFAPGAALPPPSFKAVDENFRVPYTQHASLAIERQFKAPIMVSIGGTWLHNVGLFSQENLNIPLENGTFIKPWPTLSGLTYLSNDQYGHYWALLTKLQTRQWHGATFITAFTWSKSLDNTSAGDASVGAPGDASIQDLHNIKGSFGRSSHDFQKRFTQSWIYNVPTPFKSYNSRAVEAILGGWDWSGVLTLQSGFPITPSVGFDNSQSLQFADRPDPVPGVPIFGPGNRDPYQWFNPFAFKVAAPKTFGAAGRGIFDGPGIIMVDTGLMKNFKVTEKVGLQFRWEAFNLTNHPNFADPSSDITNPGFTGRISSLTTFMRQMQFSFRVSF